MLGQLVAYLRSLGGEAITGKPYKPTTPGKNERFHQTLFRFLHKQPLAETLERLQEQIDRFDVISNTERPHQGLLGRITPQQAWKATLKVEPPHSTTRPAPTPPDDVRMTRISDNGILFMRGTRFHVNRTLFGPLAYLVETDASPMVFDDQGSLLLNHPWPAPGIKYVGIGAKRGPQPKIV